MSEMEIITDGARRHRWPAAEKLRIADEIFYDGESISAVARRIECVPCALASRPIDVRSHEERRGDWSPF